MANSQPQFSPPPYNSSHSSHPTSPLSQMGPYPPPSKRPRLSPNPQSPYVSPQLTNGSLPNSGLNSPYYMPQANGMLNIKTHSDGPPTPTTGIMGPPSRPPEEKPADLNDLSDVLHSAGINIRDEEAVLSSHAFNPQSGGSFSQASSFDNMPGSAGLPFGYFDQPSFNTLSPHLVGDRDSFFGAGTFNQPAVTTQLLESRADQARKERLRTQNCLKQYELNDPFLKGGDVWKKLEAAIRSQHIHVNDGPSLLHGDHFTRDIRTHGPSHGEQLARVQDQLMVKSAGSTSDILTLISLATKDRMRALLGDAATLAKGRRSTAHGVVPPDLLDLATGKGDAISTIFEDPSAQKSLKRSFSEANDLPTPVSENQPSPLATIAYPNRLAQTLLKATRAERAMEEARSEKRNKRNANGLLSNDASRPGSVSGPAGPGTPGTLGEQAPDVQGPKKGLTKKEQKRQADAKASEAQQHAATNSSLSMALGTRGNLFGGKKISWITSSKSAGETGFVPPAKLGSFSQKATGAANASSAPALKGIGDFREDREGGQGIQMRDMIAILEPDLREKKSLAKAYNKLSNKS